jgi:YesN/AraC family two-component response regulator
MYRIMIVDDEENVLRALKRLFHAAPCYFEGTAYPLEVETCSSPLQALERIKAEPFALVLADYRMPELDGAELLSRVRVLQPDCVRMILSGYADLEGLMKAINEARISRFIAKPWNDYDLITAIGQALAYRDMTLENNRLADECRLERGVITAESLARKRQGQQQAGQPQAGHWTEDGSAVYTDTSNWYG